MFFNGLICLKRNTRRKNLFVKLPDLVRGYMSFRPTPFQPLQFQPLQFQPFTLSTVHTFNRSHYQPLAFSTACKFNRHKFDLFN